MKTTKKSPQEQAFNKTYFVNLLFKQTYPSFYLAAKACPSAAKIANKLTDSELEYLIERIESIM